MKSLAALLSAALLFVTTATPAHADEASKLAKIEELFNVMRIEQMLPQMTQQIMAQIQSMMAAQAKNSNLPPDAAPKVEEMQKKIIALVNEKMSWQKMKPVYVKVYGDTYTEEELGGIVDFYKSPAGQAFVKKTPLLTQNIMQSMQGIMGDTMAEIPRMLDEINKQNSRKTQ
jgi:hypothetical protein